MSVDTPQRGAPDRNLTEAIELVVSTLTEEIARRIGVRAPRTAWGEYVLRYGWVMGSAVVTDLAVEMEEGRTEWWLTGGADDDARIGATIGARVRRCPVFVSQTQMDRTYGDLGDGEIETPDGDEMTELERQERVILSILESSAHAGADAVLSEYRQLLAEQDEGDDDA